MFVRNMDYFEVPVGSLLIAINSYECLNFDKLFSQKLFERYLLTQSLLV
jgi:hypothetical protein